MTNTKYGKLFPLTQAQRRIWYMELIYPQTTISTIAGTVVIRGPIDVEALKQSVYLLIKRHDAFRIHFMLSDDSEPMQWFEPEETMVPEFDYLEPRCMTEAEEWLADSNKIPFSMFDSKLYYFGIFKLSDDEYWVNLKFHHAVVDGVSGFLVGKIIMRYYQEITSGQGSTEKVAGSYVNYIRAEQEYEKSERYQKDKAYWLDKFQTLPEVIHLKPHPTYSVSPEAQRESVILSGDRYEQLMAFSDTNHIGRFTLFLAALYVHLYKTTNSEDISLGALYANRTSREEKEALGMFVSTVATRLQVDPEETILALLHRVAKEQKADLRHQKYPYNQLIQDLRGNPGLGEVQELFGVSAEYRKKEWLSYDNFAVQLRYHFCGHEVNDYILHVEEMNDEQRIVLHIDYRIALFDQTEIQRLIDQLFIIIDQFMENPQQTVRELSLLREDERNHILYAFNDTAAEFPSEKTIHERFEEQVGRTPDAPAVRFGDAVLTYSELNARANRLAWTLRERGVVAQKPVGIMVDRSLEMVVGVLAVLKAGGAFVPIDLEYPEARIRYMLENSGAELVVTERQWFKAIPQQIDKLDVHDTSLLHANEENLPNWNNSSHLLYIIYTSGTTGNPKGVMLEHRNLANLLEDQFAAALLPFPSSILQYASHSFDVCYQEMFSALLYGGTLVMCSNETRKDPLQLFALIEEKAIDILYLPAAFLKYMFAESEWAQHFPGCVKHIVTAGEQLVITPQLQACMQEHRVCLHNQYGPSETHITTAFTMQPEAIAVGLPPIGRPIANAKLYILNESMQVQPIGIVGELYVAGESVGRGYWGRPDLTDEKFVKNPFVLGDRMYRTGDLAKWLPNGTAEYVGRVDHQVKIRGFRIELSEVEAQLAKLAAVQEVKVVAREDGAGQNHLCAYFVAEQPLTTRELRAVLSQELPGYMVPSYFVQLERMPLTANGKIDRRALPAPEGDLQTGTEYVAPRTPREDQLAQIWQEVLGLDQVGVKDNFFDLGGHSLRAMTLISKVRKNMQVELSLREVFHFATVEELAQAIGRMEQTAFNAIPRIAESDYYPLSSGQRRLHILQQLEGAEQSYNMPGVMLMEGKLELERFEQAFRAVIARHETLRTGFETVSGEPVQRVYANVHFEIAYVQATEDQAEELTRGFVTAFDLSKPPLLRVGLIELTSERHLLLLDMHHLVSDGISIGNLVKELVRLYSGETLPALRIQYKDYTAWQQSTAQSAQMQQHESYWLQALDGRLPVLDMPTDYARPAVRKFEGGLLHFVIDAEKRDKLRRIANETGSTLYMVLLAAYTTFLHKYTGQEDIIVGTPIAGRTHADLEPLIGMFVNTLAIRTYPSAEKTFLSYLETVKETAFGAFEHQDYPFEELVEKLQLTRDMSRNPVFDTMFVLQNTEVELFELDGLQLKPYDSLLTLSKFDLTLQAVEVAEGIAFSFEYASSLYKPDTVQRLAGHFVQLIDVVLHQPQASLASLHMATSEERKQIEHVFNHTAIDYPREKSIHQLFEERAARTPDAPAVVFGEAQLTYRELNERANRLARTLQMAGVEAEQAVGVVAERSFEMIVGLIAILKAGGAYVPIDPAYPQARISYMLQDTGAKVLLIQRHLQEIVPFAGTSVILDSADAYSEDNANLAVAAGAGNLAYIIYTSGSTGTPKGVCVTHRGVVRLVSSANYVDICDKDVFLQGSTFSFDAATFEIWGSLLNGAKLAMLPSGKISLADWVQAIRQHRVSILFLTTGLFHVMVEEQLQGLQGVRQLLVGGDVVSKIHARKVLERFNGIRLINVYGPTENTTFTCCHKIGLADVERLSIPIGRPVSNTQVYLLGKHQEILPIGVIGELYTGGDGLALGYLNAPELNAKKFIDNPFSPGERMYRTGDLARWLPDGSIEYFGRMDNQVKIRGYRIELGEVEAKLMQVPSVREAAVIVYGEESGQKLLCAYFTAGEELTVSRLREELSRNLPGYMIPAYFTQLVRMPLTLNGKVDRKALPAPEGSMQTGAAYVAPRTYAEAQLARIWQEVLGLERVGVNDNFFEIGGHSLRATTMVSRVCKDMQVQVPLRDVFRFSTIAQLAEVITGMEQQTFAAIEPIVEEKTYYSLSSAQLRLYILNQLEGVGLSYNMPGMMMLEGALDRERFEETFRKLIARHEALRTSFHMADGEPVQRIHTQVNFTVEYLQAGEDEATEAARTFVRAFDLQTPPLLRVGLIELAPERHLFIFDMHHIISDGVSMGILVEEIGRLYSGEELSPLPIQYKDYAAWQRSESQKERWRQKETYWLDFLGGELPVLEMPTDYARPAMQKFDGNLLPFTIDAKKREALQRIAAETGSTLYMVLLAAYTILLHKYTGQEDVIVGTPIAGRTHRDAQPLIGMFVNMLALRSYPSGQKTFLSFLEEVKETALGAFEHQDYPFEELVEKLQVTRDLSRNPVFDTMFALQNIEDRTMHLDGLALTPYPSEHQVAKFDLSFIMSESDAGLDGAIEYATALYARKTIEQIAKHFEQLLAAIGTDPQAEIASLQMLTAEEHDQIRHEFGFTAAEYAAEKTIHQLIEEQVQRTPEHIAVVFEHERVTYRELNERANKLARTLRMEGVKADKLVGIMAERSLDMIVGVLAVLKAGGAFVPIDPEYPQERISYMLEDSGARLLLSQRRLQRNVSFDGKLVALDEMAAYHDDGSNLEPIAGANHLAYVIYTSGTTGKPKGVMVEHHGLCNYYAVLKDTLLINEQDRIVQFASLSFDVAMSEILQALFSGAALYVPTSETILDYRLFESFINQHQLTMATLPPNYAIYLTPSHMPSLTKLITAGSASSAELVQKWKDHVLYINAYGPTEDSIYTTMWSASSNVAGQMTVPIGRPIQNHRVYILDKYDQLLPIGAYGELCTAGAGLARGYLHRPDLTAEKFVDDPFVPGERMYRTGDLVKWLPDGNIEYLGRMDHQVKIRGYRIEPGEIEEKLLKVDAVQEAIVIAREDASNQKQLCAYFVAERSLPIGDLRKALSQELPGYMIPSYFVQLEQLPLTPNGKIDRKALPAPEDHKHLGDHYVAPRTEQEKALVSVWQKVLGAKRIGVTDPFFEFGGDSIKSIQVSSRLYQAGYKLEIRDLFNYPTIAELALHIQPVARMSEQGEVSGEVGLLPIHRWFFEQQFADPHHFNQSVMLYRQEGFDEDAVRATLQKLAEHHDALRIVFRKAEDGASYAAWNRGIAESGMYCLEVADFTGEANPAQAVEAKANSIQSSIDLEAGPLLKAGLMRCADGDHLLLVIHHGVVDGVSWRILLEDIATGHEQAVKGEAIRLPMKTDAYRMWSAQLAEYAQSPALEQEQAYWRRIEQAVTEKLPRDRQAENSLRSDSDSIILQWSRQETERLLKQTHGAYNTEMNDILLTALGWAVQEWSGLDRVLIDLEGHGRESIWPDLNITRTVGWFTSKYPVLFELANSKDLAYRIKKMKENLRQIPNKGIGYGLCAYLSGQSGEPAWNAAPQISFNYLGQFDQDLQNSGLQVSPYSNGAEWSGRQTRTHSLEFNGMITEGSLRLNLSYSAKEYRRETMERLAALLQESLREIVLHCIAKVRPELTPSDITFKGLRVEDLDLIAEQTQHIGVMENIYALTPMQKGMWFHSEMERYSNAYFIQNRFTLRGTLDIERFSKSWDHLAERHTALRTNYYQGLGNELLQIVFRNRKVPFVYEERDHLPEDERKTYLANLASADRLRGFDLQQDALMRVTVVRTGKDVYQVLWSSHHMLMDGWCLPLLAKELFDTYGAYVKDTNPVQTEIPSYSRYMEWLEKQDLEAASMYWTRYLEGYEAETALPQSKPEGRHEAYAAEWFDYGLDKSLSLQLNRVAKQHQVTLNTLLQAAWGILLQTYNRTDDVVFGGVVSGRPAELPGIEQMIGLFINTIPIRVTCQANTRFADLMASMQKQALDAGSYDYYPLYEILAKSELKQNLISHIMVYENYPNDVQMEQLGDAHGVALAVTDAEVTEQTNYDFNLSILPGEEIHLRMDFNANVFERQSVERMGGHLVHVLEQIAANPHIAVGELQVTTAAEQAEMIHTFNPEVQAYAGVKVIHQYVEEQALRTPDHAAVVYGDVQWTYQELNARANRLARTLVKHGVGPERLVGIMANRCAELLVGVLAVWKAGGAYVPIDPALPEDRIHYMLEDSGARVLIAQKQVLEQTGFDGIGIDLNAPDVSQDDDSNLETVVQSRHLAYVIYTSGTTGRPKGVMVEHGNLMNTAAASKREYRLDQFPVRLLQLASFSFDVFVGDIVRTLYNGGTMVICPQEDRIDPSRLYGWIRNCQITVLEATPALIVPFMEHVYEHNLDMSTMRLLIIGADSCSVTDYRTLQERYGSQFRMINSYGVTEASIDSSFYDEPLALLPKAGNAPIGKARMNARFYIVDANLKPVPIGVTGELCIGGPGVARGYKNRPELDKEKFVPSPFVPGERLYRTGDLARWMEDGNVDFIGRIDDQVKIRGYRIELGEIESAMLRFPGVRQAAVTDLTDERGQKYLCGYAVTEERFDLLALQAHLQLVLPAHMAPSRLMLLERMPLTPNGKVNRKALPLPEEAAPAGTDYAAPRTAAERTLAAIWQDVLAVRAVGIRDNFFELGGDSIKALQVSSRLLQAGYRLEMKDLFQYPTVAELGSRLRPAGRIADQREVTGAIVATPVLQAFFGQRHAEAHHYNLAMMFYRQERFVEEALRITMQRITEHHDALRIVLRRASQQGYELWNRGTREGELFTLDVYDLTNENDCAEKVEALASRIQTSVDLEGGPLVKLGLFRCADGDHLLLVIHHAIVDGVSWRIIIEDLAAGHEQALQGKPVQLPQKTDSFKRWSEKLLDHAGSSEIERERAYWESIDQAHYVPLPRDNECPVTLLKDSELIIVNWSKQETEQLLKQAHRAYHTEMNDLLLAALGMTVQTWSGMDRFLVNLEGHGREQIIPGMDITRTVGWFTSMFPVVIATAASGELAVTIKQVKEGLRGIPRKGIGYGILKYLTDPASGSGSVLVAKPEISFNYMGQFDQDFGRSGLIKSPYAEGPHVSGEAFLEYNLDINGIVTNGALQMIVRYSKGQYKAETMERFGELLKTSVRQIIVHCLSKEHSELTPSDVSLQGLTIAELDNLRGQTAHLGEVENVYALAPLQKGMLFHSLMEPSSGAYFEQTTLEVEGVFYPEAFLKSLDLLVQRHPILRTNFYAGLGGQPYQVVFRNRAAEFVFEDLRAMDADARQAYAEASIVKDKARGFDLCSEALMRVSVLQLDERAYRFIWSFHHILMDGWCMSLMASEVFASYFDFLNRKQPVLPPVTPYSTYIEWLEKQDEEAAAQYWTAYLAGYNQLTRLPGGKPQLNNGDYVSERLETKLGVELTEQIQRAAKSCQVTVNTFVQSAWGILLQRYNGCDDVVFGSVVSGRPEELPGVERMIGLFINTIPVRIRSEAEASFAEVMRRTQEQSVASHEYDTYPLYEIQSRAEQKQELIQHILIFENYPVEEQIEQLGGDGHNGIVMKGVQMVEQTNYSFNLVVLPGESMEIGIGYNALIYDKATVERIKGHLIHLLKQASANPDIRIHELEVVTPAEKTQINDVFNATAVSSPCDSTIHRLLEEQAERTPDQVAVYFEGAKLSYRELNERANQLARTLRGLGVKPNSLVGMMAERSLEMIIGVFAVLKAGGAFVPIDPEYPDDRIRYMLEDSGARLLLRQGRLGEHAIIDQAMIIELDDRLAYYDDGTNLEPVATADDLAYVIYTSGTTGKPKGVLVEHRGLANLKAYYDGTLRIGTADSALLFASLSFDAACWEMFQALFCGATLYVPTSTTILNYQLFERYMADHAITVAALPPTYAVHLEPDNMPALRILFTAGSATSAELIQKWKDKVDYYNGYGPTENSVATSIWPVSSDPGTGSLISIGRPVPNHHVYIVDHSGQLLPVGVPGELCVAGAGLARGYLNRPELTSEKFVISRFSGERMYRTGDLARWLEDGRLAYLGRIDQQVKIRGYRIELGEVESQILKMEGVQEVVVIAREDESGQNQLCAYFTADRELSIPDIRSALAAELPNYMVPSYLIALEQMPLTPNGKVDRKALPAPEGSLQTGAEYVAPRTYAEAQLVRIWQEVLGLERVGMNDNFFEIGGHSLRVMAMVNRVHKDMQVHLPLRDVFQFSTIAQLAEVITGMEQQTFAAIEPIIEEKPYYTASSAQKRLYILHQLEGAELSYNMPGMMMLEGVLDRERFEEAFQKLITRHETLRTSFHMADGEPVQRVHTQVNFTVEYLQAGEAEAAEAARTFVRAFDLQTPPLLRVGLIELMPERHLFMFDIHHIISDGVSMGILTEEFVRLYSSEELPPLRIQYKDYAAWQRPEVQTAQQSKQEAYWLDALGGELPVLDMRTDYARPAMQKFDGSMLPFTIEAQHCEALRRIAAETGATLYMVLLATYTILLHKYTGQEDVIVGTPVAGRTHEDLKPLIGMFVNTLAIRSYPSAGKTFLAYLTEVKEAALGAFEHQDYPFEELVEKVEFKRDLSRNPVFDTMFVLQNVEQGELNVQGLQFKPYENEHRVAKFDLTFQMGETRDGISCSIEYASALYKRETVERMAQHFARLIDEITENPHASIGSLAMITAEEHAQLASFNATAAAYPREKTIHLLFEEQAERTPEAVALVYEGEELTYGELNARSNRLARTLRTAGVQADQLVGIMSERMPDMVVGILAILKAGGAYVPIDPEYPQERINYMLEDSGVRVLLIQEHLQQRAVFEGTTIWLNAEQSYSADGTNLEPVNSPSDAAYIIYTSGTTGQPKGTLIEHKNVVRLLFNSKNLFDFGPSDTWTLFHSFCFDFSVWEMYGALLYGGKLVIVPSMTAKHPAQFLQLLTEQQVTILNQTPTYFYQMQKEALAEHAAVPQVRKVIFGGEALSPQLLKDWRAKYPATQLINMYGITETTVHVTYKEITEVDIEQAKSNIGRPIPTLKVYVLDAMRNCVPVGVAGEMYVAGEGLARLYLNRPDLTSEKFVNHPFEPGERIYRTGDLARWLPDGSLEYLGRIDHQVKIRGYRIELGEVESQLLSVEPVVEAIVTVREDESGQKLLCAYYVAATPLSANDLRSQLSETLPGYMVPTYFIELERMPLSPNGKIDRKALPSPEAGVQSESAYIAPRTQTELKLAQIWQEVLKLERVGIRDHFFEIGGHSLRATTMVARVEYELGVHLPLRAVFESSTIEALAALLENAQEVAAAVIEPAEIREYYPLSSAQKRLYILSQSEGAELSYNMPNAVSVEGPFDKMRMETAFRRLIARHESLRTGFEMVNGEPVQRVYETVNFEVKVNQADEEEAERIKHDFVRVFDLSRPPLMRVELIELQSERYIMMFDMHHIISDGTSMSILIEEFVRLYGGEELPALRIQYKDYAVWQDQTYDQFHIQHESYWLEALSGELPKLDLPTDYPRPAVRSFEGDRIGFELDERLTQALKQQAEESGVTLFMVMLAAYSVLISQYSGQEDVIVGTPVAGRPSAELEPVIGMFVNTLALRTYPEERKMFADYLQEVKEHALSAFEHQLYPFEELVEKRGTSRDASRNPIFDTMLVMQNLENQELSVESLTFASQQTEFHVAKFDLTLQIMEKEGTLIGTMEYSTKLFKAPTVQKMTDDFKEALQVITATPNIRLGDIELTDRTFQGPEAKSVEYLF